MKKDKGQTTECPDCGALAQMGKPDPEQPGAPIRCSCRYCGASFSVRKDGSAFVFADAVDSLRTPTIDDLVAREDVVEEKYDTYN